MFNLKVNNSDLESSNEGISRMYIEQQPPTRDSTGTNFPNGSISYRFSTAGTRWFVPSKSYLRMRVQLTKGNGDPVDLALGAAPAMGFMSNLFQSCEFRINDKPISRVSNYLAQVDALEQRLTKSKSWMDSVGESTNWWQPSQFLRLSQVANDGLIVKDTIAVSPADTTTSRTALGFDAVAANNNSWAYTAATGALVYARGTNGGGLDAAAASAAFPVGSYFKFVGVGGTPEVEMKVLSNNNNGGLVVEPLLNGDVGGVNNFAKVVKGQIQAQSSRRVGEFETVWQPPLSIFKVGHALPPGGKYELILTPHNATVYMKRAIESILGQASKQQQETGGADAAKIKINVVDFYLYVATVEGPRVDNITYLLDLKKTRCQVDKIDSTSFSQKNFDVSPSTYALTVAYQDLRAGEHTSISTSKFKSYDNGANPTNPQELKLNRFYINYASQNLPAPDADPSFVAGKDYTIQRYSETQLYSGAWYDNGGTETIEEWHERGPYYHFKWARDGTDNSTRTTIHQQFDNADYANMQVLLFDHSRDVYRIQIQDSRITDITTQEA